MATKVTGSVSTNPSKYEFYILWEEDNIDTLNNTSDVTVSVYCRDKSDYHSNTSVATMQVKIDTQTHSKQTGLTVNLDSNIARQVGSSRTTTVTHNADGTKSIQIKVGEAVAASSGALGSGGGFGPTSGTLTTTIVLTNIPREATIVGTPDFVIGASIPITILNPATAYVRAKTYVNGTLIKTQDLGQVTSSTLTFNSGEITAMYDEVPDALSIGAVIQLESFSDSGYTTQIGVDKDKAVTASINQTTNKPTFTTYTIGNKDKTVVVQDKYSNTLISSSTNTLVGSNDQRLISGVSDVRAVITSGNKMVALNSATPSRYRLTGGAKVAEQNYSPSSTVNIDITEVITKDFSVAAIDSRGLLTTVLSSLSNLADWSPVTLGGIILTRSALPSTNVSLDFTGTFWKHYFGGGANGVNNAVVMHYRYKETTDAWAAQTWIRITPTDDGSGNLSYALPLKSADNEGGSNVAFDNAKSYNIEVRIYDKLSQKIVEATLSKGIPHFFEHKNGVAVNGFYDDGLNPGLQVNGEFYRDGVSLTDLLSTIAGYNSSGWTPVTDSWAYASVDGSIGVITIPSNGTTKYSVGMRIKLTQTTVKYFIVVAVTATTLTVYGGTDYTLANAAISAISFSCHKSPLGFPMSPAKWTVTYSDTTQRTPAASTTISQVTNAQIDAPIGLWEVVVSQAVKCQRPGGTGISFKNGLSDATNTFYDNEFILHVDGNWTSGTGSISLSGVHRFSKLLALTVKDTLYWNHVVSTVSNSPTITYSNDLSTFKIELICAYL